jgi:hypothetical protein
VGAVQLNEVEASPLHAAGSLDEGLRRLLDAGPGHLQGYDGFWLHFVDWGRDRRRSDGRLAGHCLAGPTTAVAELNRSAGAGLVQDADETLEPGQEPVVVDAEFAEAVAPDLLRRAHLDGDQSHPSEGASLVVGDEGVGDVALGIRQPGRHRRHHKPVANLDPPDDDGGKEGLHDSLLAAPGDRTRARPLHTWAW